MNLDLNNILQAERFPNIVGAASASLGLVLLSVVLGYIYKNKKKGHLLLDSLMGAMYDFFKEILGKDIPQRVIRNVITLFFVVLSFNIFSVVVDILRVGKLIPESRAITPTTDINFTVGLAILSVLYLFYEEYKAKGIIGGITTYLPVRGSGYLFPKDKMPKTIIEWFSKIFDIFISFFIGILDMVGQLAKIVSLGGRLFGNMRSGGFLLAMAIGGGSALMSFLPGEIPAMLPIIVHIQSLFVASVQALVFSLLVAIFVKLSYE